MKLRIGNGYDLHATMAGDSIVLGGVVIPAGYSLRGHSDADALLHAITDALLGAIADKDIGAYFPPSAEENRNRPSREFLAFAHERVEEKGYSISNIDSVIICEKPKILMYRDAICMNIADILKIERDQVGVKAKTSEGVGAIGRGEALACYATALLVQH